MTMRRMFWICLQAVLTELQMTQAQFLRKPDRPANDVQPTTPETKGSTVNALSWILKLLQFVPVIATGINTVHADKSLGDKQALATDSLKLAIAGAKIGLPDEDAATVDSIGQIATATLQQTVAALHASNAPVAA